MASLFSAAMAMLSSDLNGLSVVGVQGFYRRLRPHATDAQQLPVGKWLIAILAMLAILVAVIIAWKSERVLSFYFTLSSIVAGGLAGVFALAFLFTRANRLSSTIAFARSAAEQRAMTIWGWFDLRKTLIPDPNPPL